VLWEDGGGNPASYPVRDKSCAVERKVQTDDFEQLAFRSHICLNPFLRKRLRKFKRFLGQLRTLGTPAIAGFELQRKLGDPITQLARRTDLQ